MAFIRCSRGDAAPEPLWVNKSRGELLGQTQKTDYFPKSSEEFFKWRKPRPPSGMNPPLPAHPMPIDSPQALLCHPAGFTASRSNQSHRVHAVSWKSHLPSITSLGACSLLPTQPDNPFSQGFFPPSHPFAPRPPSFPSFPSRRSPRPLPHNGIQESTSKQLSPAAAQMYLCKP